LGDVLRCLADSESPSKKKNLNVILGSESYSADAEQ
jgi:hypothetical protein